MKLEQVGIFIDGLIGKTFLNTGGDFEKNKDLIDATIDEFIADLIRYYGTLTLPEIEIAFKNGWKKQYGDFFGLNNATYFGWIKAYSLGESRSNAKKAIEKAMNKPEVKPQISEEEKERIIKEGVLNCFEHYKKTKIIYDTGNISYDYLSKKEIISFTDEVKKQIYNDCKKRMIESEKFKLTDPKYFGKHQGIKHAIKEIEENKYLPVIAESKRVALKKYFDSLIEMEIEFNDEIN